MQNRRSVFSSAVANAVRPSARTLYRSIATYGQKSRYGVGAIPRIQQGKRTAAAYIKPVKSGI